MELGKGPAELHRKLSSSSSLCIAGTTRWDFAEIAT